MYGSRDIRCGTPISEKNWDNFKESLNNNMA
jgi:hypothetical protein